MLHAGGAQVRRDEFSRGAAVGGVGGDAGDARYAQEVLVGLEAPVRGPVEILLEGVVAPGQAEGLASQLAAGLRGP